MTNGFFRSPNETRVEILYKKYSRGLNQRNTIGKISKVRTQVNKLRLVFKEDF